MIEQRDEERQLYLSQIMKARELERQQISRELHDGVVQNLLIMANYAENLTYKEKSVQPANKSNYAGWIRDKSLELAEDLRRLCLSLRPSVLDELGLVTAIRWLVEQTNREGNLAIEMAIAGEEKRLANDVELAVFRIVQESLSNIRRHSKANEALVKLDFTGDEINVIVLDKGVGFLPGTETPGFFTSRGKLGLYEMQQRAQLVGASLKIDSSLGEGTKVILKCPI